MAEKFIGMHLATGEDVVGVIDDADHGSDHYKIKKPRALVIGGDPENPRVGMFRYPPLARENSTIEVRRSLVIFTFEVDEEVEANYKRITSPVIGAERPGFIIPGN